MSIKRDKSAKKKKQIRLSLASPWSMKLASIKNDAENIILEEIEKLIVKYPQLKINIKKQKLEKTSVQMIKNEDEINQYKKEIIFGINAVTRNLEKNKLAAVVICRGADPVHLTKHILPLCAIKNVPLVSLKELNNKVAKLFNISCLMAFGLQHGVEQPASIFYSLWNCINNNAPTIPSPLKSFQSNISVMPESSTQETTVTNREPATECQEKTTQIIDFSHFYEKIQNVTSLPDTVPLSNTEFPVYNFPKIISIQKISSYNENKIEENKSEFFTKLYSTKIKHVMPSGKSGKIKVKRKKEMK